MVQSTVTSIPALDDVVLVVRVARADHFLVELTDAGLGYLVYERPPLGKPPSGHLVAQEFPQLLRGDLGALVGDDRSQWPLLPSVIGYRNNCSLENVRVRHDGILQ